MRTEDGRAVGKAHLPEKTCVACGRPMIWRKKWARDWEQVKFCSDKCRTNPSPLAGEGGARGRKAVGG